MARKAGKPFRETSEFVERTDRIAFFIEQLEKTGNPELAARTVRKYLFDYDELSDFERKYMKRVMPFYSWLRKSLPLVSKELVRQPGKFTVIPKGFRALREITGVSPEEMAEAEKWMPDWYRELGAEMVGNIGGQPVFIDPNLPIQELGKLMTVGDLPGTERILGGAARQIPLPFPRIMDVLGKGIGPQVMEGASPIIQAPVDLRS